MPHPLTVDVVDITDPSDPRVDDFRDLRTEVIIYPPQYKSGDVIYPYANAMN